MIENINSNNAGLRIECMKVMSEICLLFFNTQQQTVNDEIRKQLRTFIENHFIDMYLIINYMIRLYDFIINQ
jgi:hypothetical protein